MKSFIGKKSFKYVALVVLLVLVLTSATYVFAGETVPYTFSSGTTAKSSEVNSNFTYLANRAWSLSSSNLYYSGGNVGIGTSSPSTQLEIKGSLPLVTLNLTDSSANETAFRFLENGYEVGTFGYLGSAATYADSNGNSRQGYLQLYSDGRYNGGKAGIDFIINPSSSATYFAMSINKSGNVGIGTRTQTYPLQMGSGAYVTTGGVWTNASSREYKKDIEELSTEKAMVAFNDLKPVTFTYKADDNDKHVGFIAEDVPELLATKDRKGLSSMDVTAVLTKVVQEQQKSLHEQQKTIASLSKEVKALKDKVGTEQ